MRRTPALILGGGPAGAAAAIALARGGVRPLVIERQRETGDAICGGFLSWRTLRTLEGLGIDADALNPHRTTRVVLFNRRQRAETPLPHPAVSVSRHRLDALLLDRAEALGAMVERGVTLRAIEGMEARTADGAYLSGDAVLLATGKHDLRGSARPAEARGADPTLGLRVRLAPSAALTALVGDAIELHLFDRGYAGLALQEDGSGNLCLAVHRSRLAEAGDAHALLAAIGRECPPLGDRIALLDGDATVDAIANVPYGWRTARTVPGVYRLGDQAGVIPSLAGEGMGIALASGTMAAAAILAGRTAEDFQAMLARRTARPIGVADAVRSLAERPATGAALLRIARAMPAAIGIVARLTRIT